MPHRRFGIALGVFFVCSYRTVSAPYPSPIAEYRRALLVTEEPSPWVIIDDAPSRRRTYRPDTPPSPSPLSQQTHSQTAALPATEPDAVATRGLRRKSLPSDWMTQPAAYDPVVPSTKGVFDQVQIPSSNLSSHQVDSLRSSIAYDDFSVSLEPDQTSMTRAKMSRVALRSGGEQEKGSLNQQVFGLMASEEDPGVSTEVMKENQDETTSDTSERERAEVRDCPALEIPCPSSGATLRHDGSALPSTNSGNRVAPPSPHLRHDSIGSHWEMRSAAHENWLESRRMFLRPASPPGSTTSVLPMFSAENGLVRSASINIHGAAPARDLRNQDQAEVGGKAMTPSSAPLIRVYDYAFNAESPAIEAIDIAKPEIDSPPHISKHRASTYKSLRRTVSATRSYGALSFDHRCLERRAASLAKSTTYLSDTQSTQAGPRYLNERTETGTGMTSDCVQFADVDAEAEIAPEQSLEERHPPSSCGQDEPVYSNFNTSSSLSTATFIAIPRRSSSSASAETQKQTKIPVYLEKQVQTDPLLPEAPRVPSVSHIDRGVQTECENSGLSMDTGDTGTRGRSGAREGTARDPRNDFTVVPGADPGTNSNTSEDAVSTSKILRGVEESLAAVKGGVQSTALEPAVLARGRTNEDDTAQTKDFVAESSSCSGLRRESATWESHDGFSDTPNKLPKHNSLVQSHRLQNIDRLTAIRDFEARWRDQKHKLDQPRPSWARK